MSYKRMRTTLAGGTTAALLAGMCAFAAPATADAPRITITGGAFGSENPTVETLADESAIQEFSEEDTTTVGASGNALDNEDEVLGLDDAGNESADAPEAEAEAEADDSMPDDSLAEKPAQEDSKERALQRVAATEDLQDQNDVNSVQLETVGTAAELSEQIAALSPGAHTVTLSEDFEDLTAAAKISVPADVDLTLASAGAGGTTIKLVEGNTSKHLELTAGTGSTLVMKDLHFVGHNDPNRESFSNDTPGGGVTLRGFADVQITDSSFQGNGGAGLSPGNPANLLIANTTIAGNHTASSGAAFGVDRNTDAVLRNSTIHNNRGDGNGYDGGAVKLDFGAQLDVYNTLFSENESGRRGAAIGFQNAEGILTVTDSVFVDNEVTTSTTASHTTYNDGGAISISERSEVSAQTPTVRISGTTFKSNTAGDEAGAILAQGGAHSDIVIENSTFVDNRSKGLDTASGSDSISGGGAIEAYGTPITLINNTFVGNVAERGNASTAQNGGAVSITGGFRSLPTQNLYSAHNIFSGNQVLKADGTADESKTTVNVYATAAKLKNLEGESISGLMTPAEGNTNVGLDAYKTIDPELNSPENVFGTSTPQLATNANAKVAGDPNGVTAIPMTLVIAPNDGELVAGPADNIGSAVNALTVDQRGFPMDDPADAGATQSAFVHFDPNGGQWSGLQATSFDGSQQVALDADEIAHIYRSSSVGSPVSVPDAPDAAPEGMEFTGWNSEADGSGTALGVQRSGANAQNQTLYAQWSEIVVPPVAGTVTVMHVSENNEQLMEPEIITGAIGEAWEVEKRSFEGYEFDHVVGDLSGEFSEEAVQVTFVYKKSDPTDPTPTPTDPTPTPTDPTPTPTSPSPTPGVTVEPEPTPIVVAPDGPDELPRTGNSMPGTAFTIAGLLIASGALMFLLRRKNGDI